jgi:methyltransferase (TIGR00027 family)
MTPMQTAAPIASVRAAEGERPESERLFVDPYAHLFADAAPEVMQLFLGIPFFEEHIRLRTRFIDDAVRRALRAGMKEVILIGAGFDCRALRMPEIASAGARVIEVDHEGQLAEKRRRLAAARVAIPAHVVHAPADLQIDGELERALAGAGVPSNVRAAWVCEGLFGYLSYDDLRTLALTAGRLSGPGSMLVANYNGGVLRSELVSDAFTAAGWRDEPTPTFADLHLSHLGKAPPSGSEAFVLFEAVR